MSDLFNGLVARWPLNEGAGTTAADRKGDFPGVLDVANWVSDPDRGDVFVSNATDKIDCGSGSMGVTNAVTVSFWMYSTDYTTNFNNYVITQWTNSGNLGWRIKADGNRNIRFQISPDGVTNEEVRSASATFDLNTWTHIIVVFENGTLSVYKDGAPNSFSVSGTYPSSLIYPSTDQIKIGSDSEGFIGRLADIAVWNRALTEEERTDVYLNRWPRAAPTGWSLSNYLERAATIVSSADLPLMVSLWHNDDASGDTALAIGVDGPIGTGTRFSSGGVYNPSTRGRWFNQGGGASNVANMTTLVPEVPAAEWVHTFWELVSLSERYSSLNGANRVSDTTAVTVQTPNIARIGASEVPNNPWSSAGGLAEIAIWSAAGMTEANRLALRDKLYAGENPLAINAESGQPWTGALIAYPDLDINSATFGQDLSGNGHDFTQVGTLTAFADYPAIDEPEGSYSNLGPNYFDADFDTQGFSGFPVFLAGWLKIPDYVSGYNYALAVGANTGSFASSVNLVTTNSIDTISGLAIDTAGSASGGSVSTSVLSLDNKWLPYLVVFVNDTDREIHWPGGSQSSSGQRLSDFPYRYFRIGRALSGGGWLPTSYFFSHAVVGNFAPTAQEILDFLSGKDPAHIWAGNSAFAYYPLNRPGDLSDHSGNGFPDLTPVGGGEVFSYDAAPLGLQILSVTDGTDAIFSDGQTGILTIGSGFGT